MTGAYALLIPYLLKSMYCVSGESAYPGMYGQLQSLILWQMPGDEEQVYQECVYCDRSQVQALVISLNIEVNTK